MKTVARRTFLGLAVTFPLMGCGGNWNFGLGPVRGGGTSGGSTGSWRTVSLTGRVTPPPGLSLTGTQVTHVLGTATPGSDGRFPITAAEGGALLSRLTDSAGNTLLLGFLGDGRDTLSTRSTAEVLLFLALGLFAQAPAVRVRALALLRDQDLTALTGAIETAITATGPSWLKQPGTGIGAAVKASVHALQAGGRGRGMIITPTERVSGLQVEGDGVGACRVTNYFRRRSYLYVTPVSSQSDTGGETSLPQNLVKTELSPTNGTTSLIGTLTDLVLGNDIYQPVVTTIPTPLTPDTARSTKYKLYAVGPGVRVGELLSVPPLVAEGWREVFFKSLVFDFVVPFLATVIIPLKADQLEDVARQMEAADVVKDLVNVLAATPGLFQKAQEGDFTGACQDALSLILSTDTLQIAFLSAFVKVLEKALGSPYIDPKTGKPVFFDNVVAETWRSIDNVLDTADLAFTAFDTAVQALDIASSSLAQSWEVTVTRAKVTLTPGTSDVAPDSTQDLTARVTDADSSTGLLTYRWTVLSGTGSLKNTSSGQTGTTLDSSSATIQYQSAKTAHDGDTATVQVEAFQGGINDPNRKSIGKATSTLTVREISLTGHWTIVGYFFNLDYNLVDSNGQISGTLTIAGYETAPVTGTRTGNTAVVSYPLTKVQRNTVTVHLTVIDKDHLAGVGTNSQGGGPENVTWTRVSRGRALEQPTRRARPGTGLLAGFPPVEWE